jgi:MFS family permease
VVEQQPKFSVIRTLRISSGFFIASLFWPIYNSYVPLFLDRFYEDQLPKNVIMTIDNVFALTVIPLFAFLSDRTASRFGRRKPYVFLGTLVAAVLYAIFPNVRTVLPLFLLVLLMTNVAMASFRAPAVSLLPDLVAPEDRGKANGIITMMTGLAGLLVFVAGTFFYERDPAYPFYFVSAVMLVSLTPLIGLKEPRVILERGEDRSVAALFRKLRGKNLLKMIVPTLLWGMALTGVEATLANYFTKHLGIEPHLVTVPMAAYALTAILASVPAGYLSARIGKKRGLILALAGSTLLFVVNGLIGWIVPYNLTLLTVTTGLFGISGAMVAVNSYPLFMEDVDPEEIGSFSGLYYLLTNFHPILGPILLGAIIDIPTIGFRAMYFYGALGHALSLLVLLFVPLYEAQNDQTPQHSIGRETIPATQAKEKG